MRWLMMAGVLGLFGLFSGCSDTPIDPYADMKMLSPQEAVGKAAPIDEDPALQEERAHNAKFTVTKEKKSR